MLVDTHCHFEDERYAADRESVIEANLKEMAFVVNVTADPNELEAVVALAQKYEKIYAALGIHPHFAFAVTPDETYSQILKFIAPADRREPGKLAMIGSRHRGTNELIHSKNLRIGGGKVVAIGECGLDYYFKNQDLQGRTEYEAREAQAELFKAQINLSQEVGLPLIIHTRDEQEGFDAYQDILKILDEKKVTCATIHSFSGSLDFANQFIDRGYYLGISGILTFDKSGRLPEVVKQIPLENLLLETDAPYLTPVPNRGRRNEPRYTKFIAEKIAEIKGISLDEVLKVTEQSARKLFSIGLQ